MKLDNNNFQVAIVFWMDACKNGSDSIYVEDVKDLGLMRLISVGILLYEDEECIALGTDFCERFNNIRDVNVYPKSGISMIIRKSIIELSASNSVVKGGHHEG